MKKLLLLFGYLCFVSTAFAETQNYSVEPNKRVDVVVAEHGLNRIVVSNDRILKIVGDGELYGLEGDANHGFVFFKSKVVAPKTIPITILTEKNKVLDVNIFVEVLQEPKTVILKYRGGGILKANSRKVAKINYERLAVEAINDVRNGNFGDFTVIDAGDIYPEAISAQDFSNKYVRVRKIDFADGAGMRNIKLRRGAILATTRYGNTILIVEKL